MLSLRINKTDRNDTVGLPELPESGWQKAVTVKSLESHRVTTVLTNRALFGRHPSEPREPVSLSAQDLLCSTHGSRQLHGSAAQDWMRAPEVGASLQDDHRPFMAFQHSPVAGGGCCRSTGRSRVTESSRATPRLGRRGPFGQP